MEKHPQAPEKTPILKRKKKDEGVKTTKHVDIEIPLPFDYKTWIERWLEFRKTTEGQSLEKLHQETATPMAILKALDLKIWPDKTTLRDLTAFAGWSLHDFVLIKQGPELPAPTLEGSTKKKNLKKPKS